MVEDPEPGVAKTKMQVVLKLCRLGGGTAAGAWLCLDTVVVVVVVVNDCCCCWVDDDKSIITRILVVVERRPNQKTNIKETIHQEDTVRCFFLVNSILQNIHRVQWLKGTMVCGRTGLCFVVHCQPLAILYGRRFTYSRRTEEEKCTRRSLSS